MEPQYNPKIVEDKIYKLWEKSGFFNPNKLPKRYKLKAKSYSVMMAPPNITGSLHLGHVLENTEVDILVRMKRMQGFKTLWLPGIDHAGIATQNVVEKELRKNGLRRQDLGREKFIEKTKEWKKKYGTIILDQLKKLGISPDWSRTRYTLDSNYAKAVQTAFAHYYDKGWIYRGERVINWCPRCETGISDLEVEYREEKSKLYYIKYPLALRPASQKLQRGEQAQGDNDYIVVATTRPETMLGDTAVAVSPKDSRYKKLVGKFVILPIQNRKIPIIADIAIDPKFGTGAVKVTPAHDVTDFEISLRHNLPKLQIIDEKGIMTNEVGKMYEGLKATECREKVIEELQKLDLLEKIEDYVHNVAYCERCGTKIEPRLSKQWFLKMSELAKLAIKAVKNKETIITPKKWEKVLIDRLKNERDWNISRQLWWGHKIPLERETDVLDTWFSSALWPFATLGWPASTKDLKTYYPTDFITSARDILNIWIAKMIFSGIEFMKKAPFKVAYIHATILTKEGKRMSKSLGTGIDPLGLIEKYGADATRFGMIYQNLGNQDIRFNEDAMLTGKKFCNKIWNAARFVLQNVNSQPPLNLPLIKGEKKRGSDKKILLGLEKIKKEVEKNIEKYEFGKALHKLYDFFWHDFCDIYIEESKQQLKDEKLRKNAEQILLYVLTNSLKLLHPFLPFITEEIWSQFSKNLLLIEPWPK
jgi:valyl-tRNA synthetase